jgi:hypothetical protein
MRIKFLESYDHPQKIHNSLYRFESGTAKQALARQMALAETFLLSLGV